MIHAGVAARQEQSGAYQFSGNVWTSDAPSATIEVARIVEFEHITRFAYLPGTFYRRQISQLMRTLSFLIGMVVCLVGSCAHAEDLVRVFILAGQSNMEGKAPNALFEHQANDPETAAEFAALREGGDWAIRDDVFIKFLNRHGPLTLGYGSPNRTGVEFAFGVAIGEAYDEPVLLIKTAWGGRSIYKDFRPPSAGLPSEEKLQEELQQASQRVERNNERNNRDAPLPTMEEIKAGYGRDYRNMLSEIETTLANLGELFPKLEGKTQHIEGFVWFQGWNDQYGGQDSYAENLVHFIHDVRRDLNSPHLPIVVAAMGQNGSKPAERAMLIVQNAQLSMNEVPDFKGNVKAIRTDELIDKAAEALYPAWKERQEEWKRTGGDHPYHYLGSAIWFTRIGDRMAEAMLELTADKD